LRGRHVGVLAAGVARDEGRSHDRAPRRIALFETARRFTSGTAKRRSLAQRPSSSYAMDRLSDARGSLGAVDDHDHIRRQRKVAARIAPVLMLRDTSSISTKVFSKIFD